MMKFMVMIFTLTMMFIMTQHPLMLALILIINTMVIALLTGFFSLTYWFSFMLFMIMIGGMLVLVVYMTTIASNDYMEYIFKFMPIIMLIPLIMIPDWMEIMNVIKTMDSWMINDTKINLSLTKFITSNHLPTVILIINYLFVTLIAIVKITSSENGSLRQKF